MENVITNTYHVSGMSCGGCATTVKNKLADSPGITAVKVNLEKLEVEITSLQAIKIDKLKELLSNTGYKISELKNPVSVQ